MWKTKVIPQKTRKIFIINEDLKKEGKIIATLRIYFLSSAFCEILR